MNLSLFSWMRIEPLNITLERLVKYGYESIDMTNIKEKPICQYENSDTSSHIYSKNRSTMSLLKQAEDHGRESVGECL